MVFRMSSPEETRQLPLSPPKLKFDSIMFRFPARLWKIVNACRSGAISWGPNGKTIRIVRSQFEALYLTSDDKPFKTGRFSSFVRQLNLYGFKKVTAPMILDGEKIDYDDLYEYRHPNFRQGRSELLPYLQRNCKKNTQNCIPSLSQHKGNVFEEIQQNVTRDSMDQEHEQLRAHFKEDERKEERDAEQAPIRWNPESGIENHPLLKPFNRTATSSQSNPELSDGPSKTVFQIVEPSKESWTESGWQRKANSKTDHAEYIEGTDTADKADDIESTTDDGFTSTVNLNSCRIKHEDPSIVVCHKKSAIQALEEFVENVLSEQCTNDFRHVGKNCDLYVPKTSFYHES